MRSPSFIFILLGCLLVSSCFDIREEIWIEANGSGRAELDFVVPSAAFALAGGEAELRETVRKIIDSEPGLHLDALKITPAGNDTAISLKASTDSMLSLIDLQKNETIRSLPDTASGFIGDFDVKLDGLAVSFDRRINLQQALGLTSIAISREQRDQRQLLYIIHLPKKAEIHNATDVRDEGRTLIWKYSLGDALSSPVITSFRAKIPIPWWVFAGFALLAAILVWIIVRIWRRRIRRSP